jgi:phosphatidate cytidylyltransferase
MSDKLQNLLVRGASGVVLFGVVLGAAFLGYWGFGALMLLITVVGVWEFYQLAMAKGTMPQRCMGIVTSILLLVTAFSAILLAVPCVESVVGECLPFVLLATIAAFALIFFVEVFRNKENPTQNIASTIMGVIYVALPMSLMLFIPFMLSPDKWNPWIFLFYLFLVWGNDVFAYLVGISIGRHKMCPRLSPKKSWEGFFGGVLGSLAMGVLGAYVVEGNYLVWLGLALVVSLSSVVGDLVESMFKRDAGVKDSGNFIPGHGGMLDRFDALILSAPFAFVYLCVMMFVTQL